MFFVFDDLETKEYTKELENNGQQLKEVIKKQLDSSKDVILACTSFFYSSTRVDYDEFFSFMDRSTFLKKENHNDIIGIEWLPAIPITQKEEFHSLLKEIKLPTHQFQIINDTDAITDTINFVTIFFATQNHSSIQSGKDLFELFKVGLKGNQFTPVEILNTMENEEDLITYAELNSSAPLFGTLQLLSSAQKTDFNLSLTCSNCNNGILRETIDLRRTVQNSEFQVSNSNYFIHVNGILVANNSEENKFAKNSNNQFLIFGDKKKSYNISLRIESNSLDLNKYFFYKYLFLFIPNLLIVLFLGFWLFIAKSIVTNFNNKERIRVFTSLAKAIKELRFEKNPEIERIKKKKKKGKIEKLLLGIIKDIESEYIAFLPRQLIKRKENLHDLNQSSFSQKRNNSKIFDSLGSEKSISTIKSIPDSNRKEKSVILFYIYVKNEEDLYFNKGRRFETIFETYLSIVFSLLNSVNASFHHFDGFSMLFSFNAVQKKVGCCHQAAKIAQKLLTQTNILENTIDIRTIILKSNLLCGQWTIFKNFRTLTNPIYKDYDFFGTGKFFLNKIRKLNDELYDEQILIDEYIRDEIKYISKSKCLDYLESETNGLRFRIYALKEISNKKMNEWIYEIESFGEKSIYDRIMDLVIVGKIEEAQKIIKEILGLDTQNDLRVAMHILDECEKKNISKYSRRI